MIFRRLCCWAKRIAILSLMCLAPMARADLWRTGYFPGWEQYTNMPASSLDFSALTHIIHFSLVPKSTGALDSDANALAYSYSTDLVTRAHAAGLKVLICVGGGKTETVFQKATTTIHLPVFIKNLTNFMAARNYDGIDVDWEPLPLADFPKYTNLIYGLRSALNKFPQPKLLTVAVGAYPPSGDPPSDQYLKFADLQNVLDQINIMTYDLSGPYDGWVTWFNSPLYDGGYRFASSGTLVPSINGSVANFTNNGVAAGKLGIGMPFYGYVWTGGTGRGGTNLTGPRQPWKTLPVVNTPMYTSIISNYFQPALYHWDTNAQAAYLSITNARATNNMFISYDDERACQVKVSYARDHGLGGIMIWELALDHTTNAPDPLLQAIKESVAPPAPLALQYADDDLDLTFLGLSLWSNPPASNSWSNLLLTNISGAGGPPEVQDPGALTNQSEPSFHVQSPP